MHPNTRSSRVVTELIYLISFDLRLSVRSEIDKESRSLFYIIQFQYNPITIGRQNRNDNKQRCININTISACLVRPMRRNVPGIWVCFPLNITCPERFGFGCGAIYYYILPEVSKRAQFMMECVQRVQRMRQTCDFVRTHTHTNSAHTFQFAAERHNMCVSYYEISRVQVTSHTRSAVAP